MPRTEITPGTYVEYRERIYRVTDLYDPEAHQSTPFARLVEINVDENGKVTQGSSIDAGVSLNALRSIVYPTVVLQLAIHDRELDLNYLAQRQACLREEIGALTYALQILQHNENINRDPDD